MSNGAKAAYPHGGFRAEGLTKRELFAAMAMQGILSSFSQPEVLHAAAQCAKDKGMESDEWACTQAVSLADALLAQLEKSP